jgi:hypothetical protein
LERRELLLLIEKEEGKRGFVGNRVCVCSFLSKPNINKAYIPSRRKMVLFL